VGDEGFGESGEVVRGKRVTLCLTGSLAVYKSAEIVRRLRDAGARVRVVMTRAATNLVSPNLFAALSDRAVESELFPAGGEYMPHLRLGQDTDLVLVAPATGNILAKAAAGIADDLVSTVVLAASAPVMFAPAMNARMYLNPATQENLEKLKARGYHIVGPVSGKLGEGTSGPGRMAEPAEIVAAVARLLGPPSPLNGKVVLVTAGPTVEHIDRVRVVTNRSSGKMGYALAEAARRRGASVVLVSGPTSLPVPFGVEAVGVSTTREMLDAVIGRVETADVLIMAAAPADFQPRAASEGKITRESGGLTLELIPTPDILAEARRKAPGLFIVGFALETGGGLERAQVKLREKGCQLMVLNELDQPGSGFEVDTNQVTIIDESGRVESFPVKPKAEVAELILDRVEGLL